MKRTLRRLFGSMVLAVAFAAPCVGQVMSPMVTMAPICKFESSPDIPSWELVKPDAVLAAKVASAVQPANAAPIAADTDKPSTLQSMVQQAISPMSTTAHSAMHTIVTGLDSYSQFAQQLDAKETETTKDSGFLYVQTPEDGSPPAPFQAPWEVRASASSSENSLGYFSDENAKGWMIPSFALGKERRLPTIYPSLKTNDSGPSYSNVSLDCWTQLLRSEYPQIAAAADSIPAIDLQESTNNVGVAIAMVSPWIASSQAAPLPTLPGSMIMTATTSDSQEDASLADAGLVAEDAAVEVAQLTARSLDWLGLNVLRAADWIDSWAAESIARRSQATLR